MLSVVVATAPGSGRKKLGQPEPLSYFVLDSNRGLPQAAQLVIDPAAVVPVRSDDVQAAERRHALAEHDVHAAPRHVRRDRHRTRLARARNNHRLCLLVPRIEDVMEVRAARGSRSDSSTLGVPTSRAAWCRARDESRRKPPPPSRLRRKRAIGVIDAPAVRQLRSWLTVDLAELVDLGRRRAGHARDARIR
jgi:hypothetical protein